MKIDTNNLHLTYCTNIHPGEEWSQVFANLQQYIPPLQARLALGKPFGIGLRLADIATRELLAGETLAQFQSWLAENNLYVFTLNGFPYGGFHHQVVKDRVYVPDWSQRERLDYTLRLTHILTQLLPKGMEGSISTLPLSYKPWFKGNQTTDFMSIFRHASIHLAWLVAAMVRIQADTGKILHVNLEPEPDGLIENATEVVDYFQGYLLPVGSGYLARLLGISRPAAERYLLEHVRICYDTCHFAVEFEDPVTVLNKFQAAGIKVGKVQISAALQFDLSGDAASRQLVKERLQPFAESTYLHQVVTRDNSGRLRHYPDLSVALPYLEKTIARDCVEGRSHFHVPLFIHEYDGLQSTQADIIAVFDYLHSHPICQHLEIETYTWDVLPPGMKLDLLTSIQREYEWVLDTLRLKVSSQNLLARIH